MIKLNISYEKPGEIVKLLHILRPILKGAKIKHSNKKTAYMHTYITLNNVNDDIEK